MIYFRVIISDTPLIYEICNEMNNYACFKDLPRSKPESSLNIRRFGTWLFAQTIKQDLGGQSGVVLSLLQMYEKTGPGSKDS